MGTTYSWRLSPNRVAMALLPRLIYKCKVIGIKIPMQFFFSLLELDTWVPNLSGRTECVGIASENFKENINGMGRGACPFTD